LVSNKQKGANFVNEAKKLFEKFGWTTWKPGNKAVFYAPGKVFSQSQDIFEVADIEAIKLGRKTHYIQVTTATPDDETTNATKRRHKFEGLPMDYAYRVPVVMARKHGGGWRIWLMVDFIEHDMECHSWIELPGEHLNDYLAQNKDPTMKLGGF